MARTEHWIETDRARRERAAQFEAWYSLRQRWLTRGGADYTGTADTFETLGLPALGEHSCAACVADGKAHWPQCSCGNMLTVADRGGVCNQCRRTAAA